MIGSLRRPFVSRLRHSLSHTVPDVSRKLAVRHALMSTSTEYDIHFQKNFVEKFCAVYKVFHYINTSKKIDKDMNGPVSQVGNIAKDSYYASIAQIITKTEALPIEYALALQTIGRILILVDEGTQRLVAKQICTVFTNEAEVGRIASRIASRISIEMVLDKQTKNKWLNILPLEKMNRWTKWNGDVVVEGLSAVEMAKGHGEFIAAVLLTKLIDNATLQTMMADKTKCSTDDAKAHVLYAQLRSDYEHISKPLVPPSKDDFRKEKYYAVILGFVVVAYKLAQVSLRF